MSPSPKSPLSTSFETLPAHSEEPSELSDAVTIPLSGGGSAAIERREVADRIVVRSREGTVTLTVELGPAGPKLHFSGAEVVLEATRALALRAESLELYASGGLVTRVGGDARTEIAGQRHTRIVGADRTEAHTLETQANEGEIVLRAREDVRIDAEHIGLNDDPCPGPLAWTWVAGATS
jgi:hypothetical protein